MKVKTVGKRFSRKRTRTAETPEENAEIRQNPSTHTLAEIILAAGGAFKSPGPVTAFPDGLPRDPFSIKAADYMDVARGVLAERGQPNAPMMFQVASCPVDYVDSDAPEDMGLSEHAIKTFKAAYPGEPVPDYLKNGWRLRDDISSTWQEEEPLADHLLRAALLDVYLEKVKGFSHDSIEVLAAKIVVKASRFFWRSAALPPPLHSDLDRWVAGCKLKDSEADLLTEALELGELRTLLLVYLRDEVPQHQRASAARSPLGDIVDGLARDNGRAKGLWSRLLGEMQCEWPDAEEAQGENGQPTISYTTNDGKAATFSMKTFSNRLSAARRKISR